MPLDEKQFEIRNMELVFFRHKDFIALTVGAMVAVGMKIATMIFANVSLNVLWDTQIQTLSLYLAVMIAFDTVTGVIAARKELREGKSGKKVNSQNFWEKTVVKFIGYGVVFILGQGAYLMGMGAAVPAMFMFGAMAREGWSILENCSRMGFKIPEQVKETVRGWLKKK